MSVEEKVKKSRDLFSQQDIYNIRHRNQANILLTAEQVAKIFKKFGIQAEINNLWLYQRAMIHKSYLIPTQEQIDDEDPLEPGETEENSNWSDSLEFQTDCYERQEFLGDSILGSIMVDYIHHRYENEDEGFMTDLKNKLVRGTMLCILAKKLKFGRYLMLSHKYEHKRSDDAILEDSLEAFIGAIYIDFGRGGKAFGICQDFLVKLIERYLDLSTVIHRKDNYKAQLLEYFHKHFNGSDPKYVLISTYGPTNNRIFKAGVLNIDGTIITTGEGRRKVFAEQNAAKEALRYYNEEVYSESEAPDKELYSDSESESL